MNALHIVLSSWPSVHQKIIKLSRDLTKFRQKQVGKFFWPTLYMEMYY